MHGNLRRLALLVFAGVTSVAAACSSAGAPTGSVCPPTSTLTYDNFGKAFIEAHCASCHSSSGREREHPLLDDVTSIRAAASEIDRTSASGPNATNDEMPEDEDLATAERAKLGEWLACGAP